MLKDNAVENGVDFHEQTKVIDVELIEDHPELDTHWKIITQKEITKGEFDEPKTFLARWIVDASGRRRVIPRKLEVDMEKQDELLAFYGIFSTNQQDYITDTIIEAVETGWWYSSLLPNGTRVVVFHTDDDLPTAK